MNRVEEPFLKVYGYHFLPDYKGIYFVGWTEPTRIGNVVTFTSELFVKYLKLQDQIKLPIGNVLKRMGKTIPETHLVNPIIRKEKVDKLLKKFNRFENEAIAIDQKFEKFNNQILPEFSKEQLQKIREEGLEIN